MQMDARRVVRTLLACSAFASPGLGTRDEGLRRPVHEPAVREWALGTQGTTFGRLVDIGGQRIHIHCEGQGSPTVVFENGAGDFATVWSLVQPHVAELTRTCSYD